MTSVSELATSLLEESQLASLAPDTLDEAEPTSQRTLLHRAAEEGDLQLVARLVEMGAAIENADRNGQTPLNLGNTSFSSSFVDTNPLLRSCFTRDNFIMIIYLYQNIIHHTRYSICYAL